MPKFIELTHGQGKYVNTILVNLSAVAYLEKQPTTTYVCFNCGNPTDGGLNLFVNETINEIKEKLNG